MPKRLAIWVFLQHLLLVGMFASGVTFSFSEKVTYFQSPDPDLDFQIGDTFSGTFTFDSSASSTPVTGDSTISVAYLSAVTSWNVAFPRLGLAFKGVTGEIDIGNDTPYYLSDRYVVTLYTQGASNPLFASGRSLKYVQIDLFDLESVSNPTPADLLSSTLLPLTPPDLSLITPATQGSATGHVHFNEGNNQLQTAMTGLNAAPEPSAMLCVFCGLGVLLTRRGRR